jgi:ribosomal protein S27AE
VIPLAIPSSAVKKDQGDSEEDDRPPICPACGVTMGIREDRTSTRFVCPECGFSDKAGSGG